MMSARLCVVFILSLLLASSAIAFPFGKDSGVTELTPKNLNAFLNTHKPVFVMFYAPWCGHCKSLHPDWQKFGKGVKDVVRVGALNADAHRELGGQFGIEGFPTIKYWKMGSKKGVKPTDYQGQRAHGALHNAALAEISAKEVATITSEADVTKHLAKASSGKAIILFSSKNKSPPIFSTLSQSPHFKGKIAFLLAMEKTKALTEAFAVDSVPSFLVVSAEGDGFDKKKYEGKMDYVSIAKFLQGELGVDTGAAGGAGDEESAGGDAKEEKKPKAERNNNPAHPVAPVELTTHNFNTFCRHGAPKLRGQQPFCVIAFGESTPMKDLHGKFGNEGILFFFVKDDKAVVMADAFSTQLQPMAQLDKGDLVFLRAQKDRTKFAVWKPALDVDTDDSVDLFAGRVLGGEISFERQPGFPTI